MTALAVWSLIAQLLAALGTTAIILLVIGLMRRI